MKKKLVGKHGIQERENMEEAIKMKFKEFRKKNVGLLLILPWWIGFAIFKLYPFISSLIYSFHDYNLFRTATFSGLSNYKKILGDPLIMKAFIQTFKYAFLTVPLELIFALFMLIS